MAKLKTLLEQSSYDPILTQKLVTGFSQGFDIGYRGPIFRRHTANNLPIRVGSQTELWNKVMKEVRLKRYSGPYKLEDLPTTEYVQSPVGLVPKAGNKTRLIFHLSYDFGTEHHERSINYHTPAEFCTVKYKDLDDAISKCLHLLSLCDPQTTVFFSKTDCSSAFRLLPVLVKQRFLLIIMAIHPISKDKFYFIDLCLPFGASISCALFQSFSDALAHIAGFKISTGKIERPVAITNYLDDFFIHLPVYCLLQWWDEAVPDNLRRSGMSDFC